MDYFLTVSDEAASNIKSIVDYLKREWSEKSVLRFKDELINCFDSIVANPKTFLLVDAKRGIRKCRASKYSSAYYRINQDEIEIITVFDHRRDPERLKEIFEKLR